MPESLVNKRPDAPRATENPLQHRRIAVRRGPCYKPRRESAVQGKVDVRCPKVPAVVKRGILFLPAFLALIVPVRAAPDSGSETPVAFQVARPGYTYTFPQDHGSHDDYRTEWWYYTGHLTARSGRRFGYQLTFFRRAVDNPEVRSNPSRWAIRHLYLAHAALSDVGENRFMFGEKVSRAALGRAGADTGRLNVWIDRWSATSTSTDHSEHHLGASTDRFDLNLTVKADKLPVVHGTGGISRKGGGTGQASHYYSLTRLATSGTVTLEGTTYAVDGHSWMDHEFGSADLGEDVVGWDWFSVQLDNGTELMLYLLRNADAQPDSVSSGTLVLADGRAEHLALSDFRVKVLDQWTSRTSGARYPSGWRIEIPSRRVTIELTPLLKDQELRTAKSTQVTYWEGAVAVRGQAGDAAVGGQGYVELTGYAERFRQKL